MDKESIYQIIGYQGEYNEKIKRAIRKLLKENHPDCGGDARIFEIITTVKKELESGNVSYHAKKTLPSKKIDDLDYNYCFFMIKTQEAKIKDGENNLLNLRKDLDTINSKYKKIYRKSLDNKTSLLNNSNGLKKMNNLKRRMIILLGILVVTFSLAIIKNELILFGLFAFLAFILMMNIYTFYTHLKLINKENEIKISTYLGIVNNINDALKEKERLEKEILKQERLLNNMKNDLRFYSNLIK